MMHAAQAESIWLPYSAVVTWPTCSPLRAHRRALRAEMPIGVDLHLQAAIRKNALGDDGHHVDAVDLGADDERRGLVVGIRRAGADRSDEHVFCRDRVAVPVVAGEAHRVRRARQHGQRVHARRAARRHCRSGRRRRFCRRGCGTARAGIAGDDAGLRDNGGGERGFLGARRAGVSGGHAVSRPPKKALSAPGGGEGWVRWGNSARFGFPQASASGLAASRPISP